MKVKKGLNILLCVLFFSLQVVAQQRYEEAFTEKARKIITISADQYYPPNINIGDPEKYYWPKVLARLSKYGTNDSMANAYIDLFKNRPPFHFTLVGMARIMSLFPFTPKMLENRAKYIDGVFERDDSYNAWTAEGTENHINMSRTSGYLYAQHAKGMRPDADKRLKQMDEWIRTWAKKVYHVGNGEWNSDIYEVYNIIGWLNLYDFSNDPEIKMIAKAVLDYYASSLALNWSYGLLGGSQMRGPGVGSEQSATVYLCWLWFGGDGEPALVPNSNIIQVVHAALSTYRPPKLAVELALKKYDNDSFYWNSKPSYLLDKPSLVKQAFYVHPEYTLGSSFDKYGGWTGASYQIVPWKLVVKRENQFYSLDMLGNGRFYDKWTGGVKNPFTQLAQYKNVLVQMTKTPTNAKDIYESIKDKCAAWNDMWAKDFFIRFPSETYKKDIVKISPDAILENKSYLTIPVEATIEYDRGLHFINFGKVFVAVNTLSQKKAGLQTPKGRNQRTLLVDSAAYGAVCGFVLEVGTLLEYPNGFLEFKDKIVANKGLDKTHFLKEDRLIYKSYQKDVIDVSFNDEGEFEEPIVDWGYGTTERWTIITSPPFRQPDWVKGKPHGRLAKWSVNGNPVNMEAQWAVYDGANLIVKDGLLELRNKTESYRVDFTGTLPKFN